MPKTSVVWICPLLRHSDREVWPPWYSVQRKGKKRGTEIATREHGLPEHGFTVHNPFRYWGYIPRHNRAGENGCPGPLLKSVRVGGSPIGVNDYIVIDPKHVVPLGGLDGAVSGPRKTFLLLEFAAKRQPIGEGCDHVVRMVRAVIVDDYDLPADVIRYTE